MKCIIVEDEPKAAEVLQRYISQMPEIILLNIFRTLRESVNFLTNNPVDFIFLDINLPDQSGFELLESIDSKPQIIFTTAYSEYAVRSYEIGAVDYLLKPITFPRFCKAIEKLKSSMGASSADGGNKNVINLKSGNQTHRVQVSEIFFLKKEHNYFHVYTAGRKILIRENMENILNILPANLFVRVHKSYIVAVEHVTILERDMLHIGDQKIPIGQLYKKNVLEKIHFK